MVNAEYSDKHILYQPFILCLQLPDFLFIVFLLIEQCPGAFCLQRLHNLMFSNNYIFFALAYIFQ
jgi:hypothetical protein